MTVFVPKYNSKYNNINISSEVNRRKSIILEDENKLFIPKVNSIEKKNHIQMSYESRVEKERLRTYNG